MTPAAELPADEGRGIPGAKEQPQRGPVADGETGDLDTNTTNPGEKAALGPEKATDDEQYPPLSTVAPIMVALYLSMFLVALDRIIISTAIPKITDEFKSIDDIGWYASAYVLTGCATQLLFGRLYLFYNNKNVFLAAILLFEAGSALCGAAPTSIAFILGRAIAGCGSAGVFSGVIVIMIPLTPLRKRPMWQGFLGAIFGVSSVIGPLIGGAFTKNESLTWRWCFYINLPIGAVPIIIVIFFLHLSAPHYADLDFKGKLARMDVIGNLLFLPCIISLLLALQWGGSEYSWNNGRIIALLVLFVVLLVAWVGVQIRVKKNATVPPHIIKQRSIIAGFCFSACIGGIMLSMGYYLPIWFQAIDGVDALQSGIRGIPFVLALVVSSIIAGGFVAAVGYYTPMVILCSVLMTVGAGLLTTLHVGSGSAEWIGYQFLAGFGMGFGMQQSGMAAQVVLADVDVPVGASLMIFAQQLGGAVFVCAAQNVFLQQLVANLGTVIPREAAGLLSHVGATDLRKLVPAELLPAVLVQYNKSIMTTFYVGVAVSAISIVPALLFEWRSVKGTGKGPHDGEAMETGTKAVVARKH